MVISRATCALAMWTMLALATSPALAQRAAPLDVVLVGGRVLDPESGLDAVRTVGIRGGRVVLVSADKAIPAARDTVDVHGLAVSPGFIDLHSHGQDAVNYAFLARDGVTTALEMELGAYPVAPWYASREGKSRINFGATVGHPGARRAMLDADSSAEGVEVISAVGHFVRDPIAAGRLPELEARLATGLRDGALGIGMGINYTPAATREEIRRAFVVAAQHHVPVFVHLRSAGLIEGAGGVAGVQEVIADAASTGAALHVVHVTSMGLGATPTLLARLEAIDPAMKRKGRVRVGADADLVVFDPARVIDVATFENAAQYSTGIEHVLVNGTFVVRKGQLVPDVAPGRGIRGVRGGR